jgi:hypothetical protein
MGESGSLRSAMAAITKRVGDVAEVRRNLVLAHAFCEHKRAAAVEAVGRSVFGDAHLNGHRTPGGTLRRHPVALLLFERAAEHVLAIDLWHRWHSYRTCFYQLERALRRRLDLASLDWEKAVVGALAELKANPSAHVDHFEAHRVIAGPDGDVLVALQEWPKRRAVRTENGPVVSGVVPEWTILRFHGHGQRLDVTDGMADRGVTLANAILRRLEPAASGYELVLQPLGDRKLDEFLARLTSEQDDVFPLVEIVAEETWNPKRTMITLTGSPTRTVESSVTAQRKLGAFALDWRTVKSAKIAFEKTYKIAVFFPPAGEPQALSYSDVDRDKRVTARFAALLKNVLRVEVAPKARRGTTKPLRHSVPAPPRHSAEWWREVLDTRHDAPPDWLCSALADVEKEGLISLTRCRLLHCGSPYLDRRAVGVDSLDCDGDVEFPWTDPDLDDPTEREDGGFVVCSRGDHRWKPVRYGVPVDERVRVTHQHLAIWNRLLAELAHYGQVEEEPGRPGVASVRLPHHRLAFVYAPLVTDPLDLEREAFGRTPVVWVHPPGATLPPARELAVPLADVLADSACLADRWNVPMKRHRTPEKVRSAPLLVADSKPAGGRRAFTRVIELTDKGVALDGQQVTGPTHSAVQLFMVLRFAALQDESDEMARQPYSPEDLAEMYKGRGPEFDKPTFQTWVSRTRKALDAAFPHEHDLRDRVIVTEAGKYRLGDEFACQDRRVTAAETY